uniref:Uncharacterized protein n=1 Tax=Sphaerodactylus townsendi TaxID=933632 RepID=A0ACB8G2M8_9SAUR
MTHSLLTLDTSTVADLISSVLETQVVLGDLYPVPPAIWPEPVPPASLDLPALLLFTLEGAVVTSSDQQQQQAGTLVKLYQAEPLMANEECKTRLSKMGNGTLVEHQAAGSPVVMQVGCKRGLLAGPQHKGSGKARAGEKGQEALGSWAGGQMVRR